MSRITATDKLKEEDFPQQSWLGEIFRIINKFIGEVVAAINGGLTFQDNFVGVRHEFSFKFASNAVSFPQKISWPLSAPARTFSLVSAYETPASGPEVSIMAVCQFDYKQDSQGTFVHISDAVKLTSGGGSTGLTAGARYRFLVQITP